MKLVTFKTPDNNVQIGALIDNDQAVAALQTGVELMEGAPSPHFADMLTFLRDGPAARYKAHVVVDYVAHQRPPGTIWSPQHITWLPPLPVPESIRDAMAFEDHIINATRAAGFGRFARLDEALESRLGRKATLAYHLNKAWYKRPVYYKGNRFSVVGHEAEVEMPHFTRRFDYELEWGVIVGREGRNIPVKEARNHIAGYTIFNDFTARDAQMQEISGRLGPSKSKDFDTGNAIGPWLATPDEIPDPYALTMCARVNGQEWSRGNSSDMHWTFEQIISYMSQSETLYPGEFIGSGTCSGPQGRGSGLELGRYLKSGDVVELEVERIGVLRNRIVKRTDQTGMTISRAPAKAGR